MDPEHCYECGGKAKAKGEKCFTCDGEGNLRTKPDAPVMKKLDAPVKRRK